MYNTINKLNQILYQHKITFTIKVLTIETFFNQNLQYLYDT